MLRYQETLVAFREIPDEVALCINISGCPNKCEGCHSPHLWEDKGNILSVDVLSQLIEKNNGITCVCLMGGDNDPEEVNRLLKEIRNRDFKTGWYSGKEILAHNVSLDNLDYLKLGPYVKALGPLTSRITNQRVYKVIHEDGNRLEDITYKFWKKGGEI